MHPDELLGLDVLVRAAKLRALEKSHPYRSHTHAALLRSLGFSSDRTLLVKRADQRELVYSEDMRTEHVIITEVMRKEIEHYSAFSFTRAPFAYAGQHLAIIRAGETLTDTQVTPIPDVSEGKAYLNHPAFLALRWALEPGFGIRAEDN